MGKVRPCGRRAGFPSIVVAPCLYGDSTCTDEGDADPLNEVAPAVTAAREEFGAERISRVGRAVLAFAKG